MVKATFTFNSILIRRVTGGDAVFPCTSAPVDRR